MKISVFSVAVTIVGAYIGAGFVSGQELWQFFGSFGGYGLIGFIIASSIICLLSGATLHYVATSGCFTFDKVVCSNDNKTFKTLVTVFQFIFYIGLYVIMCAGVQSLVTQYFAFNKLFIGLLYCFAVTVISVIGAKGITAFFSAVIPILVLSSVIIAMITIYRDGVTIVSDAQHSSLISNWLVSAIVFVSYNYFAGIGVFALVGRYVKSTKRLVLSTVLAFVFFLLLGAAIILSVSSSTTYGFDMPMLQTAHYISPILSGFYALLLLFAMLGAGISSLVPFVEWFKEYFTGKKYTTLFFSSLISLITVVLSLFGFSNLIGTVYPIFGYIGAVITVFVIRNFMLSKKKNR